MKCAELVDNFCSACSLIANDFPSDGALKCLYNIWRKAVGVGGECIFNYQTCDLPVSDCGVFSIRSDGRLTKATGRMRTGRERHRANVSKSQCLQMRNVHRHGAENMPQRI